MMKYVLVGGLLLSSIFTNSENLEDHELKVMVCQTVIADNHTFCSYPLLAGDASEFYQISVNSWQGSSNRETSKPRLVIYKTQENADENLQN